MAKIVKESFVKESSLALRICDWVAKYSIYIAIFLIPIFFLPWTTDVLDFNKQAVLLVFVFVSLFSYLLKVLISGKLEIKMNAMQAVAGVLFLAYLLATIFSLYRFGSFWGQPQQISESFLTLICLLVFYFLVSNIFSKKEILISSVVLCFSAIIAEFVGVLQLLGLFIIPLEFTKSASFNMIGSVGSLGIFTAILFPLAMVLLITTKKWWRFLFALQIVLSILIIILINYPVIWWIVIAGSALTLVLGTIKSDLFNGKWMALPMFFLSVSLFFVLLGIQINWLPQRTNEIFLSQGAGFNIGLQSLKEKPIFGSGPGTFAYDFAKFKSPDFSKSSLWNITFNKSSSKVLNSLATTGLFGFLALLAFMAVPIFYAAKFLIARNKSGDVDEIEKPSNKIYSTLFLGLSVVLVQQTIAYFLYNSNIVLDFVYFFTIAALIGIIPAVKKEYVLKPSSVVNLAATLVFTLVFIFGLGVLILNGQKYIAEVNYYNGLVSYQAGNKADGLKKLEVAASLNQKSDLYFRQLSQAYLLGLQDELQNMKVAPDDQKKAKLQTYISNSINAGKIATDINSADVTNWSSRGYIYQSLFGISQDASQWAITSYDSAIKIDPYNPYLYAQQGNVYLVQALSLPADQADQKNQLLSQAQIKLEKAVSLNPSYSNALYSLGLVYDNLGQKDKAINVFATVKQLNPNNKNIQQILDNLNAGKPALQTATPPVETPPSETSGEKGTVENPPASEKTPVKEK